MADAVIDANSDPAGWGFDDRMDWYRNKIRFMKFLGVNTLSKDLLEFGTNQGWNSTDWRWYYNNDDFMRWNDLLTLAADNDLTVLPYFEYAGSVGPDGYGSTATLCYSRPNTGLLHAHLVERTVLRGRLRSCSPHRCNAIA